MKKSPRDKAVGAQMSIALQLMKRKHHQAIVKAGYSITMEQLAVLEILKMHGNMNMTELSTNLWKQNANITRIVDKLEKRKLVERKAVEGDRRAHMLTITNEGKQVFINVFPIVMTVNKAINAGISKEEEAITLKVMKKIISNLT